MAGGTAGTASLLTRQASCRDTRGLEKGGGLAIYYPQIIFLDSIPLLSFLKLKHLTLSKITQSLGKKPYDYLRIIYSKTASLFEVAAVSAAMSVGAPVEYVAAVRDYAVALGLAFQIKDDILDYSGTESVGKPLGVDILEQKMTMPLLGALSKVSEEENQRIRTLVSEIPGHPEYRDDIVEFVRSNGGIEYATARLDEFVSRAVSALDVLPESAERSYLIDLAHFTAIRDK